MGAVTYPDPNVSSLVEERFVPVKLDISQKRPQIEDAIERYQMLWTPTMVFLDEEGRELRRNVGYLPPDVMVPELWLALGAWHLAHHEYGQAFDCFNIVREKHSESKHAAEALYWCGMAAYKRDKDGAKLAQYWHELRERHPESDWWRKAEFIDKAA